jgi:hypothetical protein
VVLHLQRGGDLDAVADGAIDRAALGVHLVGAFRRVALIGIELEVVGHVDAADDQDAVLRLDLADRR